MRSQRRLIKSLSRFEIVKGQSQKHKNNTRRTRQGSYVMIKLPESHSKPHKKPRPKVIRDNSNIEITPVLQQARKSQDSLMRNIH